MLKRRIIPIELFENGRLVKSKQFSDMRDVGDPIRSTSIYSDQDADEILLLNISRDSRVIDKFLPVVSKISENCFVPLAVGGGVKTYDDAKGLICAGADKVVINSALYDNPNLITEIANSYGSQAVVACIDFQRLDSSFDVTLFSNCGRKSESIGLDEHLENIFNAGAGEIVIQSIGNDGIMCGYDFEVLQKVLSLSSIPIIIAGGAGSFLDLKKAFEMGADGAACGSLFNFGDNNPLRAKSFLKNYGIPLKNI